MGSGSFPRVVLLSWEEAELLVGGPWQPAWCEASSFVPRTHTELVLPAPAALCYEQSVPDAG